MNKTTKKPFDPSKPVQTRDGKPARIHATDMSKTLAILASYQLQGGWSEIRVTSNGSFYANESEHPLDLINVPPPKVKRDFWLNFKGQSTDVAYAHASERVAHSAIKGCDRPNEWRTVKVTAEYEPFEDE